MLSDSAIVFYHTAAISDAPDRGSTVRVSMLSRALGTSSENLRMIAGTRKQRKASIQLLQQDVERGLTISYVYAENTNAPVSLEGKKLNLLGLKQHVDFLRWLRVKRIPLGYFYRDVHWRFAFFSNFLPGPLSRLLRPLYYLDWYFIDKYSDLLFLPSRQMNEWLPRARKAGEFAAVPPGFDTRQCTAVEAHAPGTPRKLLYVGGLEDSVYSLRGTLRAIRDRDDISFTLCCRAQEWAKFESLYTPLLGDNTRVVHSSGDGLQALYREADATLLTVDESPYWQFVFPVKFSESIGYGVPVICCGYQTAIAEHVRADQLGWVIESPAALVGLLASASFASEAMVLRRSLLAVRDKHSWAARAQAIHRQMGDRANRRAAT